MFLILLCITLLVLVIFSGEIFVRGAIGIAGRFKISSFAIGATIITLGTSSPDFFISGFSVLKGHEDILSGALLGSGIANILLCIGLAGVISGVRFDSKENLVLFGMRYHFFFLLLFTTFLIISNGKIGILFSLFLIFAAGFFNFCILKCSKAEEEEVAVNASYSLFRDISFFVCGLVGLAVFSNFLLENLVKTSIEFDVPKKVIASLLVGVGNSMPEIITAVIASIHKRSRIIIGNIVGSNIFIIGFVLGFTSLFSNLVLGKEIQVVLPTLTLDAPFFMIVGALFFILFKLKKEFGRITGLIFIFIYLLYILLQINII